MDVLHPVPAARERVLQRVSVAVPLTVGADVQGVQVVRGRAHHRVPANVQAGVPAVALVAVLDVPAVPDRSKETYHGN